MKSKTITFKKFLISAASLVIFMPAFSQTNDCDSSIMILDSLENEIGSISKSVSADRFHRLYKLGKFFINEAPDVCSVRNDLDDQAIRCFELAIIEGQKLVSIPHDSIILCYTNISHCYIDQYEFNLAMDNFELAEEYIIALPALEQEKPKIISAKAHLYKERARALKDSDYKTYDALSIAKNSWELFQLLRAKYSDLFEPIDIYTLAYSGNLIGIFLMEIGELDSANQYFTESLNIINLIPDSKKDAYDWALRDEISLNLATTLMKQNALQQALNIFNRLDAELSKKHKYHILISNHLGILYRKMQNYKMSEQSLQEAKKWAIQSAHKNYLANIYDNWGDLYFEQKYYQKALIKYHSALLEDFGDSNSISLLEVPIKAPENIGGNVLDHITSSSSKARTFMELAKMNPDSSESYYNLSFDMYAYTIDLIDSLQRRPIDRDFQLFLKERSYPIYELAICTSLKLEKIEQAFLFSRMAKKSLLMASYNQIDPTSVAGVPIGIIEEERNIRSKIIYFSSVGNTTQLINYRFQFEQFIAKIYQDPALRDYYDLRFGRDYERLESIQNRIGDSTAYIDYFLGDEKGFAFYLDKDSLKFHVFDKKKLNLAPLYRILAFNEGGGNAVDQIRKYQLLAYETYKTLFGDWEDLAKNLIIIPDGELHKIPFSALVDSLKTIQTKKDFPNYLLLKHAISYDYAVTGLSMGKRQNKARHSGEELEILGFAPTFDSLAFTDLNYWDQKLVQNSNFNFSTTISSTLTWINDRLNNVDELISINDIIPVKIYQEKRALLHRFLDARFDFPIIHFATHGLADDRFPEKTCIQFSFLDDSIANDRLFVSEVFGYQIPAELVVFSSCLTQMGQEMRGEGQLGMTYAFGYAGANSTIGALWQIKSKFNTELIKKFYTHLLEMDKTEALRQAKIDMIHQGRVHPNRWAGMVLNGYNGKVEGFQSSSYRWVYYSLIGLAVLFSLIFMYKRMRTERI